MSDNYSDLDRKENERRKAMGLPPVPKEYTLQYQKEMMDRLAAEAKTKKRKPKSTDSVVVTGDTGIASVPLDNINEPDPTETRAPETRRKARSFGENLFRDAFPVLAAIVDKFEGNQRVESTERSFGAIKDRRAVQRAENTAQALDSLSREQVKTVGLLEELLQIVRELNSRDEARQGRPNVDLSRSKGGRLSKFARHAGAVAVGAAAAGGAAYLMTRDAKAAQIDGIGTETFPIVEPISSGPEIDAGELVLPTSAAEVSRESYQFPSKDAVEAEVDLDQPSPGALLKVESEVGKSITGSDQVGRIRPPVVPTAKADTRDTSQPVASTPSRPDFEKVVSGAPSTNSPAQVGSAFRQPTTAALPISKEPYSPVRSTSELDLTGSIGRDLTLRAKKITFKGDEIEFLSTDDFGSDSLVPRSQMGYGGGQFTPPSGAPTGDLGLRFAPGVDQRINNEIAEKVSRVGSAAGTELVITSGFRDSSRNAAVGGADNSAHTRGNAVDVQFAGDEAQTAKVIKAASEAGVGGIGVYRPGWLHLDSEGKRAWGPDYSSRSIPQWAHGALDGHGGSQSGASALASAPSSGVSVMSASQENAVAERTPIAPSVVVSTDSTPAGVATPGAAVPNNIQDPNDPGSVEPPDSAERYARLFNMAA